MTSRTMFPHYRNWCSAILLTLALAGYTQFTNQSITESFPIAHTATAPTTFPIPEAASEPIALTGSTQLTSCAGTQPLRCAYTHRELVNQLTRQLWSTSALANQTQFPVETTATPTASNFSQTIKFLTNCKNWIENHTGGLNTLHEQQYEDSIALSVEE